VGGFFGEIFSLPTIIYTVLLGSAVAYWSIQIALGTFDSHGVDGHAADAGHADVGHADAGHAHAHDGHAHDVHDGHGHAFDLFDSVGLRGVPLTFSLSMVVLWTWAACFLGMHLLAPLLVGVLPAWLVKLAVGLVSPVVATPVAALCVRPFRRVFATHHAPTKHAFIGRPCTITTNTVDARFGQALCEDGGAGLVISVRYEGAATLRKGQRALLVDYDPARDVYTVEPIDDDGLPPGGERDRPRDREAAS
jgi:hypothetical protein